MRVGRGFTYAGTRYEPGDDFDTERLPAHQVATFIRLYHLTDKPKRRAKQSTQIQEQTDELREDE